MTQPPNPPVDGPPPSAAPSWDQAAGPGPMSAQPPGPAGWAAVPPPSWAPAWTPPAVPGGPVAGAPASPSRRPSVGVLLALAAVVGLLVGTVASGLVVTALFTAGAEDIGREMADRVGAAVERGIVDGTRQSMEEALGAMPDDLDFPGPVLPTEQFPPVPPEDLGPDPVLDEYAQECFDGDLQACDDLLYESPPMSEYETYGSTCGGRVKEFSVAICSELE